MANVTQWGVAYFVFSTELVPPIKQINVTRFVVFATICKMTLQMPQLPTKYHFPRKGNFVKEHRQNRMC